MQVTSIPLTSTQDSSSHTDQSGVYVFFSKHSIEYNIKSKVKVYDLKSSKTYVGLISRINLNVTKSFYKDLNLLSVAALTQPL